MPFVVDTSVAMAWCFDDEATETTDQVLRSLMTDAAVVPPLWRLEVANVLLVAERKNRLSEAQAARFAELLASLPIVVDEHPDDLAVLLGTGRRHSLSAYDAAYLVLAERRGLALATLDTALREACTAAGVTLVI